MTKFTTPKASVIIPAYNAQDFIADTLTSILHQDFEDMEVIVVNDGSMDRTPSIVKQIGDPRVRLITIPNSEGPARPRNCGIAASHGEFVFFFDSDDVMLPGKLKRSIALLEANPEAGFLFTNFQSINEQGNIVNTNFLREYETLHNLPSRPVNRSARLISSEDLLRGLANANFIGTSSVAMPRSVINAIGSFNQSLKNGDDFDYWVRSACRFTAIFVETPLHQYRLREGSISRSDPLKRLESLLVRETSHGHDLDLPKEFRAKSRRKAAQYANRLAKECLRKGETGRARTFSLDSVRLMPVATEGYLLYLFSLIPSGLAGWLIAEWGKWNKVLSRT